MTYKAWNTGIAQSERDSLSEAIKDAVEASVFWTDDLPACGYIEVASIVRIPNSEISDQMLQQARVDVEQRNVKLKVDLLKWVERMEMNQ